MVPPDFAGWLTSTSATVWGVLAHCISLVIQLTPAPPPNTEEDEWHMV